MSFLLIRLTLPLREEIISALERLLPFMLLREIIDLDADIEDQEHHNDHGQPIGDSDQKVLDALRIRKVFYIFFDSFHIVFTLQDFGLFR